MRLVFSLNISLKSLSLHWEFMFARSMFQAADMVEQSRLLNRVSELVDQGRIQTTIGKNLGAINAAIPAPCWYHWSQQSTNMEMLFPVLVGAVLVCVTSRVEAAGGYDSSFGGGDGVVPFGPPSTFNQGLGIALQCDGKIVVAGLVNGAGESGELGVIRLNPDGSFDSSFATGGVYSVSFNFYGDIGWDVVIQDDARIVVGGTASVPAPSSHTTVSCSPPGFGTSARPPTPSSSYFEASATTSCSSVTGSNAAVPPSGSPPGIDDRRPKGGDCELAARAGNRPVYDLGSITICL